MGKKGTLYLIPSFLGYHPLELSHPEAVLQKVHQIEHFAVEKIQSAVQFLSKSGHPKKEFEFKFYPLDKRVTTEQLTDITKILESGSDVGVLTEAGCPGVADPGADLVWMCHLKKIQVEALVGPSAILLSVMLSGLNGQNFAFNGYLPIEEEARNEIIRKYQNRSASENQTQLFIEAPYRNEDLLKSLIKTLQAETKLAITWNIIAENQWVFSAPVKDWEKVVLPDDFSRKPAMFLFLSGIQKDANNETFGGRKKDARKRSKGRRR